MVLQLQLPVAVIDVPSCSELAWYTIVRLEHAKSALLTCHSSACMPDHMCHAC